MRASFYERTGPAREVLICDELPLERIAEAHELVEHGRVVGNVLLEVG